jgi:hypothetical protein
LVALLPVNAVFFWADFFHISVVIL